MDRLNLLKQHQNKLNKRYKQLIEQSYNLRQTDHEQSDVSAFKAIKILNKLNRLKFLAREQSQTVS
ncbi:MULTISPECIES: Lacal_2735 family protein [unclassified Olleya]|uniref:Lacal_2735 family protein n=1 Tax=unclassified Olleya TaxID=2615019 RepID=UPI0025DE28E8|nr:Lacal_2735 family protein [Olleya sp. UBA1516]|tara:strand:- start:905 stop:1102 length:198 start_codon:yes stop_codon:yes gene_type:complete